jgi:hypothetical protein
VGAMEVVETWDTSLRAGDWERARASLADDATYVALGVDDEEGISCTSADEIVGLMRSWKGRLPDVEVVEWEEIGDRVLAHLRQPASDVEWFQILSVRNDLITGLQDYPTREAAAEALGPSA